MDKCTIRDIVFTGLGLCIKIKSNVAHLLTDGPLFTTQKYPFFIRMGNIFISWLRCNIILLVFYISKITSMLISDTFTLFKYSLIAFVLITTYL